MSAALEPFLQQARQRCEQALPRLLGSDEPIPGALAGLYEATHYSLMSGGKRVRPMLVYTAAEALGADASHPALDHAACAIEMLHVYSLVHDDLPAMDDDDLRRGRPSCHRAFGEATAILVGDGLQARAFELLAEAPGLEPAQRVAMVRTLAAAAGMQGMVGGQAIDIAATDTQPGISYIEAMHERKTGALIRAALAIGGIAAGGNPDQLEALQRYGRSIGLAFQVVDDILDVTADTAVLGKTGGKDSDANKPTYVSLLGLAGARRQAAALLEDSLAALEDLGEQALRLRQLAEFIVQRGN